MKTQKAGKSRLSGSTSTGHLDPYKKSSRPSNTSKVIKEKQGPIDWSTRGLKSKYRGEKEREDAWKLWLSASKYAEKSESEHDFIIPTVKIERHPFYISYYKHLLDENVQSSSRSKARLMQKRFVFDVQEVWLTNLEHLREHNPEHMGTEDPSKPDEGPENAHRGNGLRNRRDVRAIESLESQVQSVSQKRAFANAYHTARLPNIQVVLDYEPRPTPRLQNIRCLPPTIEPLIQDVRLRPVSIDGVPALFSMDLFPTHAYVLHIDRLLPSTDYQHCGVLNETLWRFSLYRNDDSSVVQLYQCREQEVAALTAKLIMSRAAPSGGGGPQEAHSGLPAPTVLLCSGLVYSAEEPVRLPCPGGEEVVALVSVAVLGMCRPPSQEQQSVEQAELFQYFDCVQHPELLEQRLHLIHTVKLEICVTVISSTLDGMTASEAHQGESKAFLECSPAELRWLLRDSTAAYAAPLGGPQALLWWADPQRCADLWPSVAQHLAMDKIEGESGVSQYAASLSPTQDQRKIRSANSLATGAVLPEQVEGALSSLEAISCAYELLDVLRLVELPSAGNEDSVGVKQGEDGGLSSYTIHKVTHALHVEGSARDFFTHVEFGEVRPTHEGKKVDSAGSDGILDVRLAAQSTGGRPSGSSSAHPPGTPMLYFDNHQQVSSSSGAEHRPGSGAGKGRTTGSRPPSAAGHDHRAHHQHDPHGTHHDKPHTPLHERLGARAAYFQKVMAPIDPLLQDRLRAGYWEQVQDSASNLSLLSSGALPTVTQVPGACEIGRRGIWFADHNTAPMEFTQAAARYFRDQRATSSHSVLVNLTFGLDTSLLFDPLIAWEAFSSYPALAPAEEVDGTVPALTVPPVTLLETALNSPLEQRVSNTVMVFTSLPVEGVDFMPLDTPTLPKGFKRHVPTKNRYGYREQIEVTLLGVDPVLATVVFGITRTGAVPNNTGVNNRNLWHNTLAITEHINRPRAPKDYHYILVKTEHSGSNEPTRYTTRMKADKMVGLNSSAFSTYEDNYAAIQQLRDVFAKQVALDARIEKVENEIIVKQKLLKIHFQNQLQRGIEKKMRKATKSELGWRSRFKMSTLMELQGNWERRRDDRTGMFFFRNVLVGEQARARGEGEQLLQSCQWEVPAAWDGDPLSTEVGGGRERARDLYPGHHQYKAAYKTGGNASFGSLSAADLMSELREDELDPFDLAPVRWDPNPAPQHHVKHQPSPPPRGGALVGGKGAFEQPPDTWMPPTVPGNRAMPPGATGAAGSLLGGSASLGSVTNPSGRHRAGSVRSAASTNSEINSVDANKSLAESAAPTIDTANLEHIAEQLVSSDELMRVIARRLGIPESQVVPADDLSSVFSVSTAGGKSSQASGAKDDRQNPLHAPRDPWMDTLDEPEFDSDDDLWSDDEHAVGDFDDEKEIGAPEDMPQTQLEAAQLRRRELRELRGNRQEVASVPSHIPALDLRHLKNPLKEGEQDIKGDVDEEAAREEVFGWRRLPRPIIRPGFLSDALLTHTKGPSATSSNTLNAPVFLMPISPVDACKYYPEEFTTAIESIFIPDAKKDMERSIATVERNIRREEELTRNLPTDDLLLFGEATEFTSTDAFLARQRKEDLDQVRDPAEEAREKAILAAKSGNIAMMEDSLAMDADPNTTDEFGNTLLILAAQQGNKRMCKFLLRKGANINKQSIVGNTPLHYCYAYSNIALGEYLKSKGADDSIVNVDKLTCYEGLSMDSMKEFYGDDEEAHMVMPRAEGDSDSDGED